jgi:hypothetical protein
MNRKTEKYICAICGKGFPCNDLLPGEAIRDVLSQEIARDHPGWSPASYICRADLARVQIII